MADEIDLTEEDEQILDRVWGIADEQAHQDRSPTLLLQSPRNVREHLHEGLEFVDDTVDSLLAASPDAMEDITGQVLRVLTDARDYTGARKRLADAFPTLDRSQLRNMLTGGMLIAQAAGRETVQRELGGGTKSLDASRNGWVTVHGQRIKFDAKGRREPDVKNLAIKAFKDLPEMDGAYWQSRTTPDGTKEDAWLERAGKQAGKLTAPQQAALDVFTKESGMIRLVNTGKSADEIRKPMAEAAKKGPAEYVKAGYPPRLRLSVGSAASFQPHYDEAKAHSDALNSLFKGAKSEGTVYRGLNNLSEAHVKGFMGAKEVKFDSIASTSRSFNVARDFTGGERSALLIIHQRSAVSIEHASKQKAEKELLLPGGSKYTVLNRKRMGKTLVIEVEEAD